MSEAFSDRPLSEEDSKRLASLAYLALRAEDEEIRRLLQRFGPRYDDHNHGIGASFEPGMVYVIWKHLLRAEWPFKVVMELPYPSKRTTHADLGIVDEQGARALLECKVWHKENAKDLASDVHKLRTTAGDLQKFLLVVSIARDYEANREFLLLRAGISQLRTVDAFQFETQIIDRGGPHRTETVDVALYSVGDI